MWLKAKPVCAFVQHVLDEIAAGRYYNSSYEPSAFSGVYSLDGGQPGYCAWIIHHDGKLSRRGEEVPTTWRERHLLRKARRKIMDARYAAAEEKRQRLRDYP